MGSVHNRILISRGKGFGVKDFAADAAISYGVSGAAEDAGFFFLCLRRDTPSFCISGGIPLLYLRRDTTITIRPIWV